MKADVEQSTQNTMDSSSSLADEALQRSFLYSFLASVFRQEITAQDLQQIQSPEFQAAFRDAGVELFGLNEPDLIKRLEVEYAALFLGPGGNVSPHESVYAPGNDRLWGKTTVQVKRFIEDAGFEYVEDFTAMPDHLSVELDFMAQLTAQEAVSRQVNDVPKVINCQDYQRAFLENHLGTWVGTWSERVMAKAEMSFYSELARLAANFIAQEKQNIAGDIN